MSYLLDMMQPSIRVALTKWSHTEPERGFDPGSTGYKATALPFELSSIDIWPNYSFWNRALLKPLISETVTIETAGWWRWSWRWTARSRPHGYVQRIWCTVGIWIVCEGNYNKTGWPNKWSFRFPPPLSISISIIFWTTVRSCGPDRRTVSLILAVLAMPLKYGKT